LQMGIHSWKRTQIALSIYRPGFKVGENAVIWISCKGRFQAEVLLHWKIHPVSRTSIISSFAR